MILYEDFDCTTDPSHVSCSLSWANIIDITVWASVSVVSIAVAVAYYVHLGKKAKRVPDDPIV